MQVTECFELLISRSLNIWVLILRLRTVPQRGPVGVPQEKGDMEDDEKEASQSPLGLGMHSSSDKNCNAGLGWRIWLHEYHQEIVSVGREPVQPWGPYSSSRPPRAAHWTHMCLCFEAPSSLHRHCPQLAHSGQRSQTHIKYDFMKLLWKLLKTETGWQTTKCVHSKGVKWTGRAILWGDWKSPGSTMEHWTHGCMYIWQLTELYTQERWFHRV